MITPFRFVRDTLLCAALVVTVGLAPALAATIRVLDFESTGSLTEITTGTSELQVPSFGTKVVVQAFSFVRGKDGAIPKGESIGSATGGAGAGKSDPGAGKVTGTVDALEIHVGPDAVTKLFNLAASGKSVAYVRLVVYSSAKSTAGMVPVFSALMSNVRIVSAAWSGKNDKGSDIVTLDYGSIEILKNVNANAPDPKATAAGWSRVTNANEINVP
jgi:type VI protein secretion system component Hcp